MPVSERFLRDETLAAAVGADDSMRLRNDILAQAMLLKTEISIARQHDTTIICRKDAGEAAPATGSIPMMRCTTG